MSCTCARTHIHGEKSRELMLHNREKGSLNISSFFLLLLEGRSFLFVPFCNNCFLIVQVFTQCGKKIVEIVLVDFILCLAN